MDNQSDNILAAALDERLTEKLQILLSKSDLKALNNIIIEKSKQLKKKPIPASTFVRALIKDYINKNTPEQKSITGEMVKKSTSK